MMTAPAKRVFTANSVLLDVLRLACAIMIRICASDAAVVFHLFVKR
jgi:hypothetical protein